MAEQQVIQLETHEGTAEATRDKGEWGRGSEAWQISYPWGGDRFYGTREETTRRMKNAIREQAEEDLPEGDIFGEGCYDDA